MSATAIDNSDEITIERTVVMAVWKQRARVWLIAAPVLLALFLVKDLFFSPQTFKARTSLSVQQPDNGSAGASASLGALANIVGGSSGPRKYMGVLRSRRLAKEVEKIVHLQERLGIEDEDKTLLTIQDSMKAEDNATEGLLYVNIELGAPPRLRASRYSDRQEYAKIAAEVANAYAVALRNYYTTTDNNSDLVVYRNAEKIAQQAKREYEVASRELDDFFRDDLEPKTDVVITSPTTPSLTLLQNLNVEMSKLQAELRGLEAATEARRRSVQSLLQDPDALPGEDELLREARSEYEAARQDWKNAQITFADESPQVTAARRKMEIAKERLDREREGVRKGSSSLQSKDVTRAEDLKARIAELNQNIRRVKRRLKIGQADGLEMERLRDQVALKLAAVRESSMRLIALKSQKASGQSVVLVIDEAVPAKRSLPSLTMMLIRSLLSTIAILILWFIIEYILRLFRSRPAAPAY